MCACVRVCVWKGRVHFLYRLAVRKNLDKTSAHPGMSDLCWWSFGDGGAPGGDFPLIHSWSCSAHPGLWLTPAKDGRIQEELGLLASLRFQGHYRSDEEGNVTGVPWACLLGAVCYRKSEAGSIGTREREWWAPQARRLGPGITGQAPYLRATGPVAVYSLHWWHCLSVYNRWLYTF